MGIVKVIQRCWATLLIAAICSSPALAGDGTPVSSISTTRTAATPSGPYSQNGKTVYYGDGDNVKMISAIVAGVTLSRSAIDKPSITIKRIDNPNSSGARKTFFYPGRLQGNNVYIEGDEAASMEEAMNDDYITSGGLDVFQNVQNGVEEPNNIERLDFIVSGGMILPITSALLDEVGTIANEKHGNNSFKVAMITSLNGFGEPASYGPLALVEGSVDHGNLGRPEDSGGSLLRNVYMRNAAHPSGGTNGPVGYAGDDSNIIGMSFVSFAALGAASGQTVYGYSVFPQDVSDGYDLVNLTDFPTNTSGGINGADIYGGTFAIFSSAAAEAELFPAGTADLSAIKDMEIYDPLAEGLYAIPGNDVIYTLEVTNSGNGSPDVDATFLVDSLPNELEFYNADLDDGGPFSNPIGFVDSGTGMTFDYVTDTGYSASTSKPLDMTDCTYVPSAGYDSNVKHICLLPSGVMEGGPTDPSFSLKFRARIK